MRDSRYGYGEDIGTPAQKWLPRTEHTNYSLEKAKRYRVTHRIEKRTYQASAFSADEACRKLGWLIGNCFVEEIS